MTWSHSVACCISLSRAVDTGRNVAALMFSNRSLSILLNNLCNKGFPLGLLVKK